MANRTDFTVALKAADGTIRTETRGSNSRTYSHAIVGTLTAQGLANMIEAGTKSLAKAQAHLADVEARMVPSELAEYERRTRLGSVRSYDSTDEEWAACCAELGIPAEVVKWGETRRNTDGWCDRTNVYGNAYNQIKTAPRNVQDAQEWLAMWEATVVGTQMVEGWAGRPDLAANRVAGMQNHSDRTWAAVSALESNGAAELREAKAEAITARQLADGQLVVAEPTTEELEAALAAL